MRMERMSMLPGGQSTWQVVGHPFRVVAVDAAWRVVAVGDPARRVLATNGLLGRSFPSRGAAVEALGAILTRIASSGRLRPPPR